MKSIKSFLSVVTIALSLQSYGSEISKEAASKNNTLDGYVRCNQVILEVTGEKTLDDFLKNDPELFQKYMACCLHAIDPSLGMPDTKECSALRDWELK